MAIEYAYSDESGIDQTTGFCLVAGYQSTPPQWTQLGRDWRRVLRRYKVPYFHSLDFFPSKRKSHRFYQNWSDQKAKRFLEELLQAMARRELRQVGLAVNLDEFFARSEVDRRLMTGGDVGLLSPDAKRRAKYMTSGAPNSPYYLGALNLMVQALTFTTRGTEVHFVFDRQDKFEGWMMAAHGDIIKQGMLANASLNGSLGPFTYADKYKTVELQVADLIVYIWNRRLRKGRALRGLEGLASMALAANQDRIWEYDNNDFDGVLNAIRDANRRRRGR